MYCPNCNNTESKVIDSRDSKDGTRRRRECIGCEARFTTYEKVQNKVIQIVKRDERREEFTPAKLLASLIKACAKRPLPTGKLEKSAEEIESILIRSGKSEVKADYIGQLVMARLKQLDTVAYIRYASVYQNFQDIETFKKEIEGLLTPKDRKKKENNQLSFFGEKQTKTTGLQPTKSLEMSKQIF
ncbi:MAG: transcriptional regulator NrdR [Chloroflexi bacterium]|nr:transcriptional regulator NrdR [Chloroflexota bacterium]